MILYRYTDMRGGKVMESRLSYCLRESRTEAKLILADVCQKTGLSVSHLSDNERGAPQPSLATLQKLCQFYNVSASHLLGR